MNNLIATSRRGEMRALAVQGIFATDCHAQLRGLILRHLGPAHAALLAELLRSGELEPVPIEGSGDNRLLKVRH